MLPNAPSATADLPALTARARRLRRHMLRMARGQGQGYIGQGLGIADLLAALYFHELRFDPQNLGWPERDRFLLSTGHYSIALWAALAEAGVLPLDELDSYGADGSRLEMSTLDTTPGVEMIGGSLGHGLGQGVGQALGLRLRRSPARVFVELSDGEMQEGSTWEAAMAASHFGLDNLVALIDCNGIQADGRIVIDIEPVGDKCRAFGWDTVEIDGNAMEDVLTALHGARKRDGLQDGFRILLVADAAREHDQERVARQVELLAQRHALLAGGGAEEIHVHAVIAPDRHPAAERRRDGGEIGAHHQRGRRQAAADRHHRADGRLAHRRGRGADLSPLPPAAEVLDGRNPHVGHHRHPAQRAGQGGVDAPAQHLLRKHDVEGGQVADQPGQRPALKRQTAAFDRVDLDTGTALAQALVETALAKRAGGHHQRQVADLAQADDETDVGEALDEEEHAHVSHLVQGFSATISECRPKGQSSQLRRLRTAGSHGSRPGASRYCPAASARRTRRPARHIQNSVRGSIVSRQIGWSPSV